MSVQIEKVGSHPLYSLWLCDNELISIIDAAVNSVMPALSYNMHNEILCGKIIIIIEIMKPCSVLEFL